MKTDYFGTFLDTMNKGTLEQRLQKAELQNASLTARVAQLQDENRFLRSQLEVALREKGIGQKVNISA